MCATTAQCEAQWANDPCKANVVCDGASSTCKFSVLDKDGDGHPPVVCGGDDCDDSNNTVAPTKPELCDGFDNNCDGSNNEGAACTADEPCPSGPNLEDCSGQCEQVAATCATAACPDFPLYGIFSLTYQSQFPAVIRTPSQPGMTPGCVATCVYPLQPTAYAFGVYLQATPPYFDPGDKEWGVRVTVAASYKIKSKAYPAEADMCSGSPATTSCKVVEPDDTVFITTADPFAPATNVKFELLPYPEVYCQ